MSVTFLNGWLESDRSIGRPYKQRLLVASGGIKDARFVRFGTRQHENSDK